MQRNATIDNIDARALADCSPRYRATSGGLTTGVAQERCEAASTRLASTPSRLECGEDAAKGRVVSGHRDEEMLVETSE